ncbi:MAG: hypothetical protein HQ536_05185 [Parcubacteria group bacterium]|nr:hypothetical protein [Parcubacteria group bacterium]
MSDHSYTSTCPVCGNEEMQTWSTNKPFEAINCDCLDCGFYSHTVVDRSTLDEINEQREDAELKPITKKEYNKYKKKDFNLF